MSRSPKCPSCGRSFAEVARSSQHTNTCTVCMRSKRAVYDKRYRLKRKRAYVRKASVIQLGSAPGVESWPEPTDRVDREKLARARLYHADLQAGRDILFIGADILISDGEHTYLRERRENSLE